jgi:hypothetical protein
MPCVGFELTIPDSERVKTVHALGWPYTSCVKTSIKEWDKRDKSWRQHHDSDLCAAIFIISFVSTVLLSLRHVADIVSWLLHVLTHAGVRPTLDRSATVIDKDHHTEFNLVFIRMYVGTEGKYGNLVRPLYPNFTPIRNGTGLEVVRSTLENVYGTT